FFLSSPPPPPQTSPLSLHDALPILDPSAAARRRAARHGVGVPRPAAHRAAAGAAPRHTAVSPDRRLVRERGAGGAAGAARPPARYRSRGRALRPSSAPVAREAVAPAARGVAGPVGYPGGPHPGGGGLPGGRAAGPVGHRLPNGFDADRL